jgi:hypothetical protein
MQGMDKNDQDHFRTALLASRLILRVVAVVVTVLLTWVWFTVDDSNARVMLLGAVVFATGSALMVGNTYRLKDIRQRQLAGASDNPARMREVRAALTPEQTVSLRMWLACGGMALGAMGVLLAIIINDVDDVAESIVVAFLILATSLACAYAGTLLRALD